MREVNEALRLFVVPAGSALTAQQRAGAVCVWCPRCPLRPCPRGQVLEAEHLAAREQAGKPKPSCAHCRAAVEPGGERVRPHLWLGGSGPVHGYLHTRVCPAPRQRNQAAAGGTVGRQSARVVGAPRPTAMSRSPR
ncbi:hypothetical protein [Streptomyces sp. G45]|uniref:hypothetical protein n=1 Tax=Streptomyces sp. G45 TaxID=3406627 RepID=UPI003C212030